MNRESCTNIEAIKLCSSGGGRGKLYYGTAKQHLVEHEAACWGRKAPQVWIKEHTYGQKIWRMLQPGCNLVLNRKGREGNGRFDDAPGLGWAVRQSTGGRWQSEDFCSAAVRKLNP